MLLRLDVAKALSVGRLGECQFAAGYYAYVGSAFGSGGIRARVNRHLKVDKRTHWHLDYLRPQAKPDWVFASQTGSNQECAWAASLSELEQVTTPITGFGASDCQCHSHLFYSSSVHALRVVSDVVHFDLSIDCNTLLSSY